jgi:hypothetical protein
MKMLCCDRDPESCETLRAELAAVGIECVIKDARDTPLFHDRSASAPPALPELWVVDDSRFERAWSILNGPDESGEESREEEQAGET